MTGPDILDSVYWVVQTLGETSRYFGLGDWVGTEIRCTFQMFRDLLCTFQEFWDPCFGFKVTFFLIPEIPGSVFRSHRNSVAGPDILDSVYPGIGSYRRSARLPDILD